MELPPITNEVLPRLKYREGGSSKKTMRKSGGNGGTHAAGHPPVGIPKRPRKRYDNR